MLAILAGVLVIFAFLAIIGLIFIGGQVSSVLSEVGTSIGTEASESAAPVANTPAASAPAASTPAASETASSAAGGAESADPFASDPYSLVLPSGWVAIDASSPASKAALDAWAKANPAMADMVAQFESSNLYRIAVNQLTGNIIVSAALPTQGLTLDQIGQSLGAQFATVPGASGAPTPDPTTLPAGDALHWTLTLSSNNATGGSVSVTESIYVVVSGRTGVIVEFVTPAGGVPTDEGPIINSLVIKSP